MTTRDEPSDAVRAAMEGMREALTRAESFDDRPAPETTFFGVDVLDAMEAAYRILASVPRPRDSVEDFAQQSALSVLAEATNRPRVVPSEHLSRLVRTAARAAGHGGVGFAPLVGMLEASVSHGLPEERLLLDLLNCAKFQARGAPGRRIVKRLEALIFGDAEGDAPTAPDDDAWGEAWTRWVATLPETSQARWAAVLKAARSARAPAPTPTLLGKARAALVGVPADEIVHALETPLPALRAPEALLSPDNEALLRGLVQACSQSVDPRIPLAIAEIALAASKKVPGIGARAPVVANGAVCALGVVPEGRGVAALLRVREKNRSATTKKLIERTLSEAAKRAGLSVVDLEEISIDTFGLDASSRRELPLGDDRAVVEVDGASVSVRFFGADGRERKATPAGAKRDHVDQLADVEAVRKGLTVTLAAHRVRFERMMISGRTLPVEHLVERFVQHPAVGPLVRRLVVELRKDDRTVLALPDLDGFVDVLGARVDRAFVDGSVAKLMHPAAHPPDVVRAWRARVEALGLRQPVKQAHREVYALTPVEREAGDVSRRFFGHWLFQHQAARLLEARGWQYELQGEFDGDGTARRFGAQTAAFELHPGDPRRVGSTGILRFVGSGEVSFPGRRLDEVDPIVFSETLRDVDLVTSVAGVVVDPSWPSVEDYAALTGLADTAHAALAETGIVRRDLLARLLPRLAVAPRCTLDERHVVVRGSRGTYRIHLGSASVMHEETGRHLCIQASKGEPDVALPFEGDTILSLVLSKILLLADDASIRDRTLLAQLGA